MYRYAAVLVACSIAWAGLAPDLAGQNTDRNKLTAEEIAEKPEYRNALEVIRMMRANWLRPRPSGNFGSSASDRYASGRAEPAVYIDNNRIHTGVLELGNVRTSEILEIRYLSGNNALARYGNGHEYGAIFVETTRVIRD